LQNEAKDLPKISKEGRLGYDTKQLTDMLKQVKAKIPEQRAVTVAPEDTIQFEEIADTMDQIEAADLPDIVIMPATS